MKIHPDYPNHPGVVPKPNRHGTAIFHRFRHGGIDKVIPGQPGSPEFERVYQALVTGQQPTTAEVIKLPTAAHPKSLKAAYELLKKDDDWLALDSKSRKRYGRAIEKMLDMKSETGLKYSDGPVEDLLRKNVKQMLLPWAGKVAMKRVARIALQKVIGQAMAEWDLRFDPTARLPGEKSDRQKTDGRKTWPQTMLDKYEARWPIGTKERLAYALGLWLGNRISDIADLDWSNRKTVPFEANGEFYEIEGFEFKQFKGRNKKGGKTVFLPLTPMLRKELEPFEGPTEGPVLLSSRKKKYGHQSLSGQFSKWAGLADIDDGYTAHGLRKALGVKLAMADVSSRTIMAILGHSNLDMVEIYTREANEIRLASQGMAELAALEGRRVAADRPKLTLVN